MSKKTKKLQDSIRQGDVLTERVAVIPPERQTKLSDKSKVILAHGEVTGHAHVLEAEVAADCERDGTLRYETEMAQGAPLSVSYMEIKSALAALKHDEHAAITHEAGCHRVVRQREYSPEAIRNVAD